MTLRIFLLVISSALLLYGKDLCPDDYTPQSFEIAGDGINDLLNEYFSEKKINLPPASNQIKKLKLIQIVKNRFQLSNSMKQSGRGYYPATPGIWRIDIIGNGITVIHLLVKEPNKLSETESFNNYNDMLDDSFNDYDNQAYAMTMLPDEIRRNWNNHYISIAVKIYGILGDATQLDKTYADIIITDYSKLVLRYIDCNKIKKAHK